MTPKEFYDKWNPRQSELVSDLFDAVQEAGEYHPENATFMLRYLITKLERAYQGICEGLESPAMASPADKEIGADIVAVLNTLGGTNYTVNW